MRVRRALPLSSTKSTLLRSMENSTSGLAFLVYIQHRSSSPNPFAFQIALQPKLGPAVVLFSCIRGIMPDLFFLIHCADNS
jgi:hypothetical protein